MHASLARLSPVTNVIAQFDPLREDRSLLEAALTKADVKVEHKTYDGVTHELFGMAAVVKDAADAQACGGQALKKAFKP